MSHPTEALCRIVLEAGFDRVGALPLAAAGDPGIAAWLEAGRHGAMCWMERHLAAKADPARAFPEFRSVLVAALEYGEVGAPEPDPAVGNLSRYARGDDYHDVLKQRLHLAADRLRDADPELATRVFVDTGPLNEKLVAARAGLGWVGKHTNLIDPARGSYLFLGLILVSAEVEPTRSPEPDRCGRCEACIPACPTDAIVAPYVLDARRCISYLTIELRGSIPRELRPAIGHRIFGCDDCQEVCPWNRFARRDTPEPFRPREALKDRSLSSWLSIDREEWQRVFRRSAVKRAKYEGFVRNLLVAAGNSGQRDLVPAIRPRLEAEDPVLREHAAWALGRLGGPEARQILRARLTDESDDTVREEIRQALGDPTDREPESANQKNTDLP